MKREKTSVNVIAIEKWDVCDGEILKREELKERTAIEIVLLNLRFRDPPHFYFHFFLHWVVLQFIPFFTFTHLNLISAFNTFFLQFATIYLPAYTGGIFVSHIFVLAWFCSNCTISSFDRLFAILVFTFFCIYNLIDHRRKVERGRQKEVKQTRLL